MNHCQCTQKIGLHHNPVCKLHGVISLDNIIPPDKSPLVLTWTVHSTDTEELAVIP